ncbi:MAG: Uma2 family endonuclease, partial [Microcystis aeruginosa G11-01]|nr:Uma2 family endonuclease [Microcystis aeruginosa LL11-07]NCS37184.1 Uma2 family endonuclease [Microcystis aeruginosa G11-01]
LYEFLATAKEDEVRAEKNLRAWLVSQLAKNN